MLPRVTEIVATVVDLLHMGLIRVPQPTY